MHENVTPEASSAHDQGAGRPGSEMSAAAMLAASGIKRTKGKGSSATCSRPDLRVGGWPAASRSAEKQMHAGDCERSGQQDVKCKPC